MSKSMPIEENVVSPEYWRKRFIVAKEKVDNISILRAMISGDPYYDSAAGSNEYNNVMRGNASAIKTQRAVLALEKYIDSVNNMESKSHLKKIHVP